MAKNGVGGDKQTEGERERERQRERERENERETGTDTDKDIVRHVETVREKDIIIATGGEKQKI